MFLFEYLVLFIFQIDLLSTHETIITVLFCLFSSFYCFLSHIYIFTGTIMSDQNNRPHPPNASHDKFNRVEKHGNEEGWG
jgi:hypothetical protein